MSCLFFNTDDLADNGRYRLPWIYSLLSAQESGLVDHRGVPRPKTWRIPRTTLLEAIERGEVVVHGPARRRYVRGCDLRRFLQGELPGKSAGRSHTAGSRAKATPVRPPIDSNPS